MLCIASPHVPQSVFLQVSGIFRKFPHEFVKNLKIFGRGKILFFEEKIQKTELASIMGTAIPENSKVKDSRRGATKFSPLIPRARCLATMLI